MLLQALTVLGILYQEGDSLQQAKDYHNHIPFGPLFFSSHLRTTQETDVAT